MLLCKGNWYQYLRLFAFSTYHLSICINFLKTLQSWLCHYGSERVLSFILDFNVSALEWVWKRSRIKHMRGMMYSCELQTRQDAMRRVADDGLSPRDSNILHKFLNLKLNCFRYIRITFGYSALPLSSSHRKTFGIHFPNKSESLSCFFRVNHLWVARF